MKNNPQRSVLITLILLGILYFTVFIFPNYTSVPLKSDDQISSIVGKDEAVIYPIIVRMLSGGSDIHDTWSRLIIYGDYHYGYPFYFISLLVLLPAHLILGRDFNHYPQLNLLLLRQLISVLPMIISAGFVVYLLTRFKNYVRSVALFIFILTIPSVVQSGLWWWHPDGLAILAVVLTLFFLDRDNLRFGRNFWFAAVACGMAAAIKLFGFFFILTIPAYLVAGLIQKRVRLPKAALLSVGFVAIMGATILFSNPFLFYPTQRAKMMKIQFTLQDAFNQGFADGSIDYQKGPQFWKWTLENWFAPLPFLGFLCLSLMAGTLSGENRRPHALILSWIIPISLYYLYFVSPKPDHYWLSVMLPLFGCGFSLIPLLEKASAAAQRPLLKALALAGILLVVCLVTAVFAQNLAHDITLWSAYLLQQRSL